MARQTRMNWMLKSSGKHEIEYIMSVDRSDVTLPQYCVMFTDLLVADNRSSVQAINAAAEQATGDILIVVSDDFECPENWDEQIVKAAPAHKNWVMKTQDGTQGWIITLPIMDRFYYEEFGYIYYPQYEHMFSDTDLTSVADMTGRKVTASINFIHNHYTVSKVRKDSTSLKADATWSQGEALYLKRYREDFGLQPNQIKGKIKHQPHIEWIKNKMRRMA